MNTVTHILMIVSIILVGFLAGVVEESLPSHLIEEVRGVDDNDISSVEPKPFRRQFSFFGSAEKAQDSCRSVTCGQVTFSRAAARTEALFETFRAQPSALTLVRD